MVGQHLRAAPHVLHAVLASVSRRVVQHRHQILVLPAITALLLLVVRSSSHAPRVVSAPRVCQLVLRTRVELVHILQAARHTRHNHRAALVPRAFVLHSAARQRVHFLVPLVTIALHNLL